jgi:hypothetical protein
MLGDVWVTKEGHHVSSDETVAYEATEEWQEIVSVVVFGRGFYMLLRLVELTTVAMHRRKWINVFENRTTAVTQALGWGFWSRRRSLAPFSARDG